MADTQASITSQVTRTIFLGVVFVVTTEIGLYAWKSIISYFSRRRNDDQYQQGVLNTALFFPDPKPSCIAHFTHRHGCTDRLCRFSHEETAFGKLVQYINSARKSLDICIFSISSKDLANLVIDLHQKGVVVRLITDNEQISATGAQTGIFRKAGIQVRLDPSTYFMHHKFLIVDNKMLINGSFNWTRQAITGNQENVFISTEKNIVTKYQSQFEKLWIDYNPQK